MRNMRIIVAGLFALAAFALDAGQINPAHADPYRWCAEYGGGRGGGTNCYFMTIGQCRAAISGNGGLCRPNTFYDGQPVSTSDRIVRRKRIRG